ncbi:uncharacterized protein LY79DRAFT_535622 [Colletotrichum navitas]|uniref:Uncharacterized protein n=1 Tax=Colletotrichum navitas TaxID=681940 RepID=A0AAD8QBR2_9PEZI|nr:uncharacterized protein LY79DRAFT_535622 [Colletotrichum navitas]KAK1599617.1 hypothetical protein LY79DRAFT_535622 [Colletotrichum navitas]
MAGFWFMIVQGILLQALILHPDPGYSQDIALASAYWSTRRMMFGIALFAIGCVVSPWVSGTTYLLLPLPYLWGAYCNPTC